MKKLFRWLMTDFNGDKPTLLWFIMSILFSVFLIGLALV